MFSVGEAQPAAGGGRVRVAGERRRAQLLRDLRAVLPVHHGRNQFHRLPTLVLGRRQVPGQLTRVRREVFSLHPSVTYQYVVCI